MIIIYYYTSSKYFPDVEVMLSVEDLNTDKYTAKTDEGETIVKCNSARM